MVQRAISSIIEFTATGAKAQGRNSAVVFPGRFASYSLVTNHAPNKRYVPLEICVEGDVLMP